MIELAFVVGFDGGHDSRDDLEHVVLEVADLLPKPVIVCTHEIRDAAPHYAASLGFDSTPADLVGFFDLLVQVTVSHGLAAVAAGPGFRHEIGAEGRRPGALVAAGALWNRTSGRALRFPGQDALTGVVEVDDVLTDSAIDDIELLGDSTVFPGTRLRTQEFVRPRFVDGRLVLVVRPFSDGEVVPFEVEHPTRCCAHH